MSVAVAAGRVREAWAAFAVWMGFGVCDGCGEGRYLARQPRSRKRECLECFEFGPPEART